MKNTEDYVSAGPAMSPGYAPVGHLEGDPQDITPRYILANTPPKSAVDRRGFRVAVIKICQHVVSGNGGIPPIVGFIPDVLPD